MVAKKWEHGTRRTLVASIGVLVLTAIMLALPESALALPSEIPDNTPMIDGRVRAIEQVDNNIWLGGRFTQVKKRDGTVLDNVGNLAVLDSQTNQYKPIAPNLGGTGTEVWDIEAYGGTGDVLIAGKFAGPTTKQKNLVLVDGATGDVIRWYNSPPLKTVLAAPDYGRVYGGGVSLTAFDFKSPSSSTAIPNKIWTRSKTSVDPTIRTHVNSPAYRDLERDGQTIWAACVCDAVDGNPAKGLVKLGIEEGNHYTSWLPQEAGVGTFGESVVDYGGKLYLAAGGSDFVAKFDKAEGALDWKRDTSGSAQALEVMDDKLVVGGHFYAVADEDLDKCGSGRTEDTLNLIDCQRRQGIAAYSFQGDLDPNWDPAYSGSYSLVWALHVEGSRLHTGGEFKKVSGVVQNSYARLSPASLP